MDKTAVVILNYNGVDHLQRFLPSVIEHTSSCQVVVIDNHSTDSSVDYLSSTHSDLKVISLEQNYGFSGGYNKGLKFVDADNYILLNSDVQVTSGWADQMIHYMQEHPGTAICQPKILSLKNAGKFDYAGAAGGFLDILGYPFCRGRIFDHIETDDRQYDNDRSIFWAGGACFFIRAAVYHRLGGFDEDFFAHMEEIDLCWRSQRAGYQTGYVYESVVYHLGGGTLKDTNPFKTYLNFRNGLELLVKNSSVGDLVWKLPTRVVLDLIACLKFFLQGSFSHFTAVLKAEMAFLVRLPDTWHKRTKFHAPYRSQLFKTLIVWDYFVKGRSTFQAIADQT
ncbi:MAG: glycosyl transferase family 2 [Cyclobacteriaceae bacterium]|nr:MAG: glycosyl transferase family 2 [Cyclobacteriaceae bacterium]